MEEFFQNNLVLIYAVIALLIVIIVLLISKRGVTEKVEDNRIDPKQMSAKDEIISNLENENRSLLQNVATYKSVIERHNINNMPAIKSFVVKSSEQLLYYSKFVYGYVNENPLLLCGNAFYVKIGGIMEDEKPKVLIEKISNAFKEFDFEKIKPEFDIYVHEFHNKLEKQLKDNSSLFGMKNYSANTKVKQDQLNSFIIENIDEYNNAYFLLSGEYFERFKKIVNPNIGKRIIGFFKELVSDVASSVSQAYLGADVNPLAAIFELKDLNDKDFVDQYAKAVDALVQSINDVFSKELSSKLDDVLLVYQEAYIAQNADIIGILNNNSLDGKDISPIVNSWECNLCK